MSKFYTDFKNELEKMTAGQKAGILYELQAAARQVEAEADRPRISVPTRVDYAPRRLNERGLPMTEEEIWDADHPLKGLWVYGYCEKFESQFWDKPKYKHYTDQEVDDHNRPIIEAWLKAKRKVFPNATVPPTVRML